MAIFIKVDDVKGESKKAGYEDSMEALNFNYGMSAPHSAGGTGHSGGNIEVHPASFSVMEGRHSIEFWKKLSSGEHFKEMTVKMTKQTGDSTPQVWKQYTLKSVYVTNIGSGDNADSNSVQNIMIAADEVSLEYFSQDDKGVLTSVGKMTYDSRKAQTA